MPTWNPAQYLTFAEQRTRPARDLAARVATPSPQRIVDLGCGPGNSTLVCKERWPEASILGIDNSADMIATARAAYPDQEWVVADIAEWVSAEGGRFDIIFANAALQWVPDHETVLPLLAARLTPGGALAAQMPSYSATPNRILREMAAAGSWRRWFPEGRTKEWLAHDLEFYYRVLKPCTAQIDLWATEYLQIMPDVAGIVEWYKGTGLRPYLDAIGEAAERERFLAEYLELLRPLYPESAAGGVPFPFRRIFFVAYAAAER